MWGFTDIRERAIQELSSVKMNAVDQILLAKEYKVPSWLIAGYHELVRRIPTLSLDEAQKLGLETSILLCHIREEIAATGHKYRHCRREDRDFTDIVRRVSEDEIQDLG